MDIKECLEKRYLVKVKPSRDIIEKELKEAEYDLEKAGKSYEDKDFKWSIVMSYYAMFHAARAVLFKFGYREKRHFAVGVVLEELNRNGKLESKYINDFNAAIYSREDADYHYTYSEETAKNNLESGEEFIKRMNNFLKG